MSTPRFVFRTFTAALTLGIIAAVSLFGQVAATLESGYTRLTPMTGSAIAIQAIGTSVSLLRPWASAGASASWSRFADSGGTTKQAAFGASAFSGPIGSRVRAEVALSGSVVGAGAGTSARLSPVVRLHHLGSSAGAWIGGGYGLGRQVDATRGVASGEAAVWVRRQSASVTLLTVPTAVQSGVSYLESALAGRLEGRSLDLVVTLGHRTAAGSAATQTWANAALAAWLTDRVALLASGGRFPEDPIQRFGGGRFFSVGLRLATQRPDRLLAAAPRSAADFRDRRPDGPIRLSVEAVDDALQREIVIVAPRADNVELQGDVTAWAALPLRREGPDRWVIRVAMTSGPQRLTVRINGGPWIVPAGATIVEDDFGGTTGLVVVP